MNEGGVKSARPSKRTATNHLQLKVCQITILPQKVWRVGSNHLG